MRVYSTLHLHTNSSKGTAILLLFYISHSPLTDQNTHSSL